MSSVDLETTKSLLHFDNLLKDEIGLEIWSKSNNNVTSGDIIKFGHASLYPNTNGALLCTNNTGIWSLNSNRNYEIEFFVYVVKHGGNKYLFSLMAQDSTSYVLMLSLTTAGYLEFTATGWDISDALTGSTALTVNTWYHVLIRVSNQTLKIFLDGTEEISADLPENVDLNIGQVRLGYLSSNAYKYYIDEFVFRHSAENGNPVIPSSPYVANLQHTSLSNTKSLLHFEDLPRDEISIETWRKSKTAVTSGNIAKFWNRSLYANTGNLIGTNNSGIWNLNSNGDYEIEFFIYPTAHGGTRTLFRLRDSSTILLNLSLNTNGTIKFECSKWGCSGTSGSTVLAVNEWHHIMLRISNQTATVFLDGSEDISAELSAYVRLSPNQVYLSYFSATDYAYYMDEFLFRYSAGTGTPTIPTSPYTFCAYAAHTKRNFGKIKSLLHFDYPYFNEPNDGLTDEIGLETWTKNNTANLFGSEIPIAGTLPPKFGYRCLGTKNGNLIGTNESSIWNINSSGKYEIEMFVRFADVTKAQNIFSLTDNTTAKTAIFTLALTADGVVSFSSSGFEVESISGTTPVTANVWHYIVTRIAKEKISVYLDGSLEILSELPAKTELLVGQAVIGNNISSYWVYVDEFVFRHSASKGLPEIPSEPYNGTFNPESIGGYGTGSDGDITITANTQINSYGLLDTIKDSRTFTVKSWTNGTIIPDIGTELMIHITAPISTAMAAYPFVGLYSFAKIAAINETSITLDRDITTENGDVFTLYSELLKTYYIQAITVPNYSNLTINSGCTVNPLSWNTTKGGGIVAFRCTGDCTINGSIITHGKGAIRYDLHQMTHSQLIDRFLCSQGGGLFITCGGTFSATSTARLGATWSGLGDGSNGAAGYGGKGGSIKTASNKEASGGKGGVGDGGGGATGYASNAAVGGNVGSNGSVSGTYCSGGGGCGGIGGGVNSSVNTAVCGGGGGGGQGNSGGAGGTITHTSTNYNNSNFNYNGNAGTINGGNYRANNNDAAYGGAGGGAPGGNGGAGRRGRNSSGFTPEGLGAGIAGASIVLVCDKLKADTNALSTGGGSGTSSLDTYYSQAGGAGGGGTGFCYIVAGELLNE